MNQPSRTPPPPPTRPMSPPGPVSRASASPVLLWLGIATIPFTLLSIAVMWVVLPKGDEAGAIMMSVIKFVLALLMLIGGLALSCLFFFISAVNGAKRRAKDDVAHTVAAARQRRS